MSDDTMAAIRELVAHEGHTPGGGRYLLDTGKIGSPRRGLAPVVVVLIWVKRRIDRAFKTMFGWCHPRPKWAKPDGVTSVIRVQVGGGNGVGYTTQAIDPATIPTGTIVGWGGSGSS